VKWQHRVVLFCVAVVALGVVSATNGYSIETSYPVHSQLTDNPWDEVEAVASPDGGQMVYYGEDYLGLYPVVVYRWSEAAGAERLAQGQTPSFSLDSQHILWSGAGDAGSGGNPAKSDIWIMSNDATGSGQTPYVVDDLTSLGKPSELPGSGGDVIYHTWAPTWSIRRWNHAGGSVEVLPVVGSAQQPRVSPDGRYIAYHSQSGAGTPYDVYLFDLLTSSETRLTWEGAEQGYPAFSPDGQWIVYQSKEDGGAYFDLWLMDLSGGNRHQITFEDLDQRFPSFMPDGDAILYSAKEDGGADIDVWIVGAFIQAIVDIDPDVLNLTSQGNYITCYIQLPPGYSVGNVDVESVHLVSAGGNAVEPPLPRVGPWGIGAYDEDVIEFLMVKFDRQELIGILESMSAGGDVSLRVEGELYDGTPFAGSDLIRITRKGNKP